MSLVRIALRMATVLALKGRTLAQDNVLDSEIGVLTEDDHGLQINLRRKGRFIAVYTDESEAKPDEQRMFHDNGLVELCIEYGVTDTMSEEVDDPDHPGRRMKVIIPGIPHADRMHEFYLDLLGRQIRTILSDGTNEGAEVLRMLLARVIKVTCERAGSDRKNERVAAQKLTFTVEAMHDPQFLADVPEEGPIGRFLALLEAGDPDDQKLAELMRAEIPATPEEIEENRARVGVTLAELNALGLGYEPDADADTTIAGVTLDMTGTEPVEVS
ncbi:hypothetical protein [Labrenzia sp. OB1]|uniref:hypothetical protein n=1 Tax=Labrenzia sp. OB1 TaxID=1561204 RepID=UPI000AF0A60D|nr:hypothetical protein [Labrenzia sp. OB1]